MVQNKLRDAAMNMKLLVMSCMIACLVTPMVQAASICNAKIALADARLNLMMMVMSTENTEQNVLKKQIVHATIALEKELNHLLNDQDKTNDVHVMIFKKTWTEFKQTRETGIIPAIYAGNNEKAFQIATGIQAKRMKIMNSVIKTLQGDDCN